MRVTSKGQVTIPIEIREQLGIHAGSEVEFTVEDGGLRLRKVAGRGRGAALVAHLRRHRVEGGMSTDEIMALTRGE